MSSGRLRTSTRETTVVLTEPQIFGYRRFITDLIESAEADRPPRPALPHARREHIERLMGQLVSRADLAGDYRMLLEPMMARRPDLMQAVRAGRDTFQVDDVVSRGLGCLSDTQLARLALDGIELETLADYLNELFESGEYGEVWDALILNDTAEPVPYETLHEAPPPEAPPTQFALEAQSPPSDSGAPSLSWVLRASARHQCAGLLRLPEEVSLRCYGTLNGTIALFLHRHFVAPGRWRVGLTLVPAPSEAGIVATVTFRDGSTARFPIMTPGRLGPESEDTHLADSAFGTDGWPLLLHLAPLDDSSESQ